MRRASAFQIDGADGLLGIDGYLEDGVVNISMPAWYWQKSGWR